MHATTLSLQTLPHTLGYIKNHRQPHLLQERQQMQQRTARDSKLQQEPARDSTKHDYDPLLINI